jgi:hypothetical protein
LIQFKRIPGSISTQQPSLSGKVLPKVRSLQICADTAELLLLLLTAFKDMDAATVAAVLLSPRIWAAAAVDVQLELFAGRSLFALVFSKASL